MRGSCLAACVLVAAGCSHEPTDESAPASTSTPPGDSLPEGVTVTPEEPPPYGPHVDVPPLSTLGARCIDGWCWVDPFPFGDALTSLAASRSDNVWFTGANGLVLHFDGSAWSFVDCGTQARMLASSSSGPNDAWFTSDVGVYHWNGTSCAAAPGAPSTRLVAIWSSGPDDVFVSDYDNVIRFDGAAWTEQSALVHGLAFSGSSRHNLWLFGTGSPLHWDGAAWATAHSWPTGGSNALFEGTARRTDSTWAMTPNTDTHDRLGPCCYSTDKGPPQMQEHFDGSAWEPGATLPDEALATSITSAAPDDVWVNSANGILHLVNGAFQSQGVKATFVEATAPFDVWGLATGYLEGGGSSQSTIGTIEHFDGTAWTTRTPETTVGDPLAIAGSSPNDIWLSTGASGMVHYDGASFARFPSEPNIATVWVGSPSVAWAGGLTGLSRWDGSRWTLVAPGDIRGISGSSPSDIWAVDYAGVLTHFNGTAWTTVTTPMPVFAPIWVNGPNDVWLNATVGPGIDETETIGHFDGSIWTTQTVPQVGLSYHFGDTQLWSSGPTHVWLAGSSGVDHYDGKSWQTMGTGYGSVSGTGPNDVTFKIDNTLAHWDGATSTKTTVPDVVERLWASAPGETWSIGHLGVLRHRTK